MAASGLLRWSSGQPALPGGKAGNFCPLAQRNGTGPGSAETKETTATNPTYPPPSESHLDGPIRRPSPLLLPLHLFGVASQPRRRPHRAGHHQLGLLRLKRECVRHRPPRLPLNIGFISQSPRRRYRTVKDWAASPANLLHAYTIDVSRPLSTRHALQRSLMYYREKNLPKCWIWEAVSHTASSNAFLFQYGIKVLILNYEKHVWRNWVWH